MSSFPLRHLVRILLLMLFAMGSKHAAAQGINVVGGGTLSYVRPSAAIGCGKSLGTVYNFYGFVYYFNGVAYGLYGGTFWRSIECSTLQPDPTTTITLTIPTFQGGTCSIAFTIFTGDNTSAVLNCDAGSSIFLNPKFLIMGVTYAPPGGSSSSVSYQNTSILGNTSMHSSSFTSNFTETVDAKLSFGAGLIVTKDTVSLGINQSSGWNQVSTDSQTITINKQTSTTLKTPGVPNVYSPVQS